MSGGGGEGQRSDDPDILLGPRLEDGCRRDVSGARAEPLANLRETTPFEGCPGTDAGEGSGHESLAVPGFGGKARLAVERRDVTPRDHLRARP